MAQFHEEIVLHPVTGSDEFWILIDELIGDQSSFWHNRTCILNAFRDGRLYGLNIHETDLMYERGVRGDPVFARAYHGEPSFYLLPCFCVVSATDDKTCDMIWVHTRARRKGLGRKLVRELGIRVAREPVPEAKPFWDACLLR